MAASSSNPLDVYRRRSVFNVEEMAVALEGEDVVNARKIIWDTLGQDPLFVMPAEDLTLEEQRRLSFHWEKRIEEYNFLATEELAGRPTSMFGALQALTMLESNTMRIGGNVMSRL